ncbi:MAG: hypothetical protein AUG50_00340 [Betaproteobacteria bacterium 13_1_20CM_3_63_8]|nr:MAG: hypothetical protein AUG50_00340 [Betaproteobacteria bacterium 13_1_20CM_3_63_8]
MYLRPQRGCREIDATICRIRDGSTLGHQFTKCENERRGSTISQQCIATSVASLKRQRDIVVGAVDEANGGGKTLHQTAN